jgi:hypothetical protein
MITKSEPGIWCDYCKTQWGKRPNWFNEVDKPDPYKDSTGWHKRATTVAVITVTSVNPKSHGQKRHYCEFHALDVTTFTNTTTHEAYRWSLQDQVKAVAPIQLEMDGKVNG